MEIQVAVSKINQYSSSESGDTLEVVERPNGGVSIVLADPRTSGREAKIISTMIVRKIISLLAEGVRDGAAARAASDQLYTEKKGMVTAFLNILSADLQTGTLVITRNSLAPIFIARGEKIECLSGETTPIGSSRNIKPSITEFVLEINTTIVMYTDGLLCAGKRIGQRVDICTILEALLEDQQPSAQYIADTLLNECIRLDQGQPEDDMSVVVLKVVARGSGPIRRMTVQLPVINEYNPPTN